MTRWIRWLTQTLKQSARISFHWWRNIWRDDSSSLPRKLRKTSATIKCFHFKISVHSNQIWKLMRQKKKERKSAETSPCKFKLKMCNFCAQFFSDRLLYSAHRISLGKFIGDSANAPSDYKKFIISIYRCKIWACKRFSTRWDNDRKPIIGQFIKIEEELWSVCSKSILCIL